MKKYQVFISSTYEDLKEHRRTVMNCLWSANCIPTGMEYFTAADSSQLDYIRNILDSTDVYVLIIGGRYGSIDPESGLSYTEREYQIAEEKSIPVLAFTCADPQHLSNEQVDKDRTKLDDFKSRLETKLIAHWNARDDPSKLAMKVMTSVTGLINEQRKELKGWNRGSVNDDDMPERLLKSTQVQNELQNKVKRLEKQNQELQRRVELLNQDDSEDENFFENEVQILGDVHTNEGRWTKLHSHLKLGRIFKLMAGDVLTSCPVGFAMSDLEEKLPWEFAVSQVILSPPTRDEIKVQLYMNHLIDIGKEPDTDEPGEIEVMMISDKGKRLLSGLVHDKKYDKPAVTVEQIPEW